MPRISARTGDRFFSVESRQLVPYVTRSSNPDFMGRRGDCRAFSTEEGWLEQVVLDRWQETAAGGKTRTLSTRKVYCDFEIRDKKTDRVRYAHRR